MIDKRITIFTVAVAFSLSASLRAASPPADGRCVLSADVIAYLQTLGRDPHEIFEERRRSRHDMIEESPYMLCLHRTWRALHGLAPETSESTGGAASGASDEIAPLAATIGSNVAPPTVLPPIGNGGVPDYQGETSISVNPKNPLQIVGHANTFYSDPAAACQAPAPNANKTFGTMALFGSNDGGVSWHYNCAPWPSDATGAISGAAAFFGSDPALDWDGAGNAYAVYLLIDQNGNGTADGGAIAIAKSTDSGLSWSPLGTIVNNLSDSSVFDDKEFAAIDRTSGNHAGRIYVIWDENNAERIGFSESGASGTWTTVVLDSTHICIGADVKVGADGTVYAVWNRLGFHGNTQSSETTVFAKSTDGGVSWSSAVTVATHRLFSFGTNNTPPAQNQRGVNCFPALDVDRNPASSFFGRLYVTYPDFPLGTTSGSNLNVYLKSSANGGATWTADPGVLVNNDGGTSTQFFPWLAVDQSDGTVNLSWYDTRNDAVNNRRTQIFYGRSSNGGVSVEPNMLLTDGGSNFVNHVTYCDENSTDNTNFNPNQYGDYSGISANNRQVHSLWTDSRNLYPNSADGRLEDVATTTIVNCSPPVWSATPTVSCSASGNSVSWTLPAFGTNATTGTFSVNRYTDGACTQNKAVVISGLSGATTNYVDSSGSPGVSYHYSVTTINNCPGTALTPMSATSACSAAVSSAAPTITGPSSSCPGQQITLDAGAGFDTYSWTPGGATTQTISPSPTTTTTYSVTVTKAGSCPGQDSHQVTVTALTAVASGSASICPGSSTALSGSGGLSCSWTPTTGLDNASSCAPNASPSVTTTYTLTVTSNGCSSTNAPTATVTVRATPTPTPATLADGAVSVAYAQTIGSSTGTAPFSFAVVLGALPNGLTLNATTGQITGAPTVAQDFSFTIRVTDANGCTKDKVYTIHVTNLSPQLEQLDGRSPYPPALSEPNGVLESGKVSGFAPFWKNIGSTTASGVAGIVSNFTGPNNGTVTYSIADNAASYGTLAAAATTSCGSDCYTLGLTSTSRPAPHWDATVKETLSNGQAHTWTLHVGKSFTDVGPTTGFYSFVETIFHYGITLGIGGGLYGPSQATQRGQMTAFIARTHLGSDAATPVSGTVPGLGTYDCESGGHSLFSDVMPTDTFCRSIHYIVAQGLSFGCTDGTQFTSTFCPSTTITRATMAVFLARDLAGGDASVPSSAPDSGNGRAYNCTDGLPNAFSDVPDSEPRCKYVYFIWSKNIVDGFGNGTYAPNNGVLRDQMSKFLTNAYKLTISGP